MKFDLLKKTRSPKPERSITTDHWLKHQFYARGYCRFSKSTSKELKEDINPDIRKHLSFIFTPTNGDPGESRWCINSWIGIVIFWRIRVPSVPLSANRKSRKKGWSSNRILTVRSTFHTRECDGNSAYHRCWYYHGIWWTPYPCDYR
jgi:hypothetical protein